MTEKRQSQRFRALKGALIVFNRGNSTINCVVRNLSATGALLRVESPIGIPDSFVLKVSDGAMHVATVVRRNSSEIGVSFAPLTSGHKP